MGNQPPEWTSMLPLEITSSRDPEIRSAEDEVIRLFDELRSPLLRYLRTFGLPLEDGEEVVQEVFLALFRHLQSGKPRTHLRGWVFKVAQNLGLKRRKTQGVHDQMDDRVLLDPAPTQEDQLAGHRRQQRILAVVLALPEQDRRCLYLKAEGFNYRKIGEIMNMSLGAVANSLARSLAKITRATEV